MATQSGKGLQLKLMVLSSQNLTFNNCFINACVLHVIN